MGADHETLERRVALAHTVLGRLALHRDPGLGRKAGGKIGGVGAFAVRCPARSLGGGGAELFQKMPGEGAFQLLVGRFIELRDLGDGATAARARRDEGGVAMAARVRWPLGRPHAA